jgi:hypothetical protein
METFSYVVSCLTCGTLGWLLSQYFQSPPAPRRVVKPPTPYLQSVVILDMSEIENLKERIGLDDLSPVEAAHLLQIEKRRGVRFQADYYDEDSEPEDPQRAQRRLDFQKWRFDTNRLNKFPDEHMSGGETL